MRNLLFNLQGVPEEEADEIRVLLYENGIVFYETSAGRWRIGLAGIWLPDDQQKAEAQRLINAYQQNRYQSFEAERDRLKNLGLIQGLVQHFYMQPLKVSGALVAIIAILAISIVPFVRAFT